MSVKVSSWVWHDAPKDIRGNQLIALLALADIADDDGECMYFAKGEGRTQSDLAGKARMSVATFRRATGALAERGLLEISRESAHSVNVYRIMVTAQVERSSVSALTAQTERSDRSTVSDHKDVFNVLNVDITLTFGEFWSSYPRKVGKVAAEVAFRRAVKNGTPVEKILAGARRYADDPNRTRDKQFIPHPSTWLSQGRWSDEPEAPRSGSRQDAAVDVFRKLREEEQRAEVGHRPAIGAGAGL